MYIGIDPSLRSTGICLLGDKGNYLRSWQIKTDKKMGLIDCLGYIRKEMGDVHLYLSKGIDFAEVKCVGIETPFVGNNKLTAHILSAVWGSIISEVLIAWCPKDLMEIHPGALKRFAAGNNNADKERVRRAVDRKWSFTHDCMDIVDAFVVAQMARCAKVPNDFTRDQYDIVLDHLRLKNAAAGAEDA